MPVDEFIDAHIHLFDLRGTPRPMQPLGKLFGWSDRVLRTMAPILMPNDAVDFFGRRTALLGDYMPPDYRADAASSEVSRYVHVQAGWKDKSPLDPVGETAWLDALEDGPAAIVAYADLDHRDVDSVLTAHTRASTRMRGIRHMLSWHPADGVMNFAENADLSASPEFRRGVATLAEHELTFDAWCYSNQLNDFAELAAAVPDVDMVLCHVGTPVGLFGEFSGVGVSEQERARIGDEWRDGISSAAERSNVSVKLSGLLMPVLGLGYEQTQKSPSVGELVERLSPVVEHVVGAFGPTRCMIGSNFPVDRVSVDYATVTAAMIEMTSRYGQEAQQEVFAGTAARFYRLEGD